MNAQQHPMRRSTTRSSNSSSSSYRMYGDVRCGCGERVVLLTSSLSVLQYTLAIDIWSIGCIFTEVLTGKPLFPVKSVVHQLDLITDLLGTPSPKTIAGVRNDKARKYLMEMQKKLSPMIVTLKAHSE